MQAFSAGGLLVIGTAAALALELLAEHACGATQFPVGGWSGSWTVPADNSTVYNNWAEKMRFQIGDSLLFVYPSSSDSVLQVTIADYNSCNTESPLEKHTDGNTVFKFNHSGPYYFISGNRDHCLRNEKLVVVVMADRAKKAGGVCSAISPASSPTTTSSPHPPPPLAVPSPFSVQTPPSSTPSGIELPSPPPPLGEVNSPPAAPSTLSTPPGNDAAVAAPPLSDLGVLVSSVGVLICVAF